MIWPSCKIDGCRNKCCRRLESPYCHPHTLLKSIYDRNDNGGSYINEELTRLFDEGSRPRSTPTID